MNALRILGSIVYGSIMYFLLWTFLYAMTPKLMGLDWYGFFFILPSFLWLFQVSVVVVLLVSPMLWICKKSLAAKIVHIPIGLYFAWYCVRLPWSMDMEYGLLQWILALSFLKMRPPAFPCAERFREACPPGQTSAQAYPGFSSHTEEGRETQPREEFRKLSHTE